MDAVIVPLIEFALAILIDPVVLVGTFVLVVALSSGLAARVYEAVDLRLTRRTSPVARRALAVPHRR